MKQKIKELTVKMKFKLSNIILKLLYISLTIVIKMARKNRHRQTKDKQIKQS
jgi:hypothetical protein